MLEANIESLRQLYLSDSRPWMVGFSGGKDSSLVAHLIFEAVRSIPADDRTKVIHLLCTDTRVEIPAVVETIEGTLNRMQQASNAQGLGINTHLLRPPADQSFWVNIIGRGYPPPNRVFRWCTPRLKIDPVNVFVERWLGRDGEAIIHLGARRSESASRAQTLADYEVRNGLRKHPNLPRVAVSNPIENLTTEEVWAYLLQHPTPWGGTHKELYRLYNNAGGGECPVHLDTSTPSCGSSRFGCWTCTVVERDKASEGLLASGDDRMEPLIAFRARLQFYQNPESNKRDKVRMNGTVSEDGWGPEPDAAQCSRSLTGGSQRGPRQRIALKSTERLLGGRSVNEKQHHGLLSLRHHVLEFHFYGIRRRLVVTEVGFEQREGVGALNGVIDVLRNISGCLGRLHPELAYDNTDQISVFVQQRPTGVAGLNGGAYLP